MSDMDDRAVKVVSDYCGYLAGGRWDPLIDGIANALAEARREALEEAAQACVGSGAIVAEARLCASAIRLLKDER